MLASLDQRIAVSSSDIVRRCWLVHNNLKDVKSKRRAFRNPWRVLVNARKLHRNVWTTFTATSMRKDSVGTFDDRVQKECHDRSYLSFHLFISSNDNPKSNARFRSQPFIPTFVKVDKDSIPTKHHLRDHSDSLQSRPLKFSSATSRLLSSDPSKSATRNPIDVRSLLDAEALARLRHDATSRC